jgi:hypothetical protein
LDGNRTRRSGPDPHGRMSNSSTRSLPRWAAEILAQTQKSCSSCAVAACYSATLLGVLHRTRPRERRCKLRGRPSCCAPLQRRSLRSPSRERDGARAYRGEAHCARMFAGAAASIAQSSHRRAADAPPRRAAAGGAGVPRLLRRTRNRALQSRGGGGVPRTNGGRRRAANGSSRERPSPGSRRNGSAATA